VKSYQQSAFSFCVQTLQPGAQADHSQGVQTSTGIQMQIIQLIGID
jgi:hypothetical protein